jgi:L-fucose dehydrogenase
MDLQLRNKIILITGGAKGIGAAITRACAEEGAIPMVVDRDKAAGEQLHTQLADTGVPSHFLEVDLASSQSCQDAVQGSAAIYGRLDGLVNNAGINDKVGLATGDPEGVLGMQCAVHALGASERPPF